MSDDQLYESSYRRVVIATYAVTGDLRRAGDLASRAFASMPATEAVALALALRLARRDRGVKGSPTVPRLPARCVGLLELVDELPREQRTAAVLHHLALVTDESIVDSFRLAEANKSLARATGLDQRQLAEELTELRELLTESIPQPDLLTVRVRVRERRSNSRVRIAAALAVVAVAAAVPVLRATRPIDNVDDLSFGRLSRATPYATSFLEGGDDTPFLYGIDFADPTHGYALRGTCTIQPSRRCTDQLLVTSDGQHWKIRRIPETPDSPQGARLLVLGATRIAVEDYSSSMSLPTRHYSDDAGRTWQLVPATISETVPSIPEGGIVDAVCPDPRQDPYGCAKKELVVTLPATGHTAVLSSQPDIDVRSASPIPDQENGWWASGKDPVTGQWTVAVSRDAGRTWSFSTLTGVPETTLLGPSVQAGPGVLYATVTGVLPDTKDGLLAIYRSTDAGATWQQSWHASTGVEPRRIIGDPIVTPDGHLLVIGQAGKGYLSTDGGVSFQPTPKGQGLYWVFRVRGGYLSASQENSSYSYSADGVSWTTVTPPLR